MFELDENTNQLMARKAEIDAMAKEFAENAPTCVCRGCETHGCDGHPCREDTQPALRVAPMERLDALGKAYVPSEELEGMGSNEDEWETITTVDKNPLFCDDLFIDLGGEG